MNRLITFEGVEGSGKSTQMRMTTQQLIRKNVPLTITQEPTGTDIGRKIGGILFNRGHDYMSAEAELFLFCAARAQHVREVIEPALKQGRFVLCDRFSDATFAYQGAGRGLDLDFIRTVNDYSAAGVKPAMTLLFDLPVEIGLQRALERDNRLKDSSFSDRFEKENIDFHNRVREGYLQLRRENPERFRLIDADRDAESIQKDVLEHVTRFIEAHD